MVFYLFIDCDRKAILAGQQSLFKSLSSNFFTKNRITFTLVSALTFVGFTGLFYWIYGYEYLYESLLYHFVRRDNRHNYSVYFMMIYQSYDTAASGFLSILAFLPQWLVIIAAGLAFYQDLFLALVIQTWCFVAFNKVVTEQYFLWYLSLLPFIMINNGVLQTKKGILAIALYGL